MSADALGARIARPAAAPLVGLLAAAREELAGIERRLAGVRRERRGGMRWVHGTLGRSAVVAVCTGEGSRSARAGALALVEAFPVELVVVAGLGGAISPSLPVGSLFVARRVLDGDAAAPEPDALWSERLERSGAARPATFVTSPVLLSTAASKREAWSRLGAEGAALVDLETAAVAVAAHSRGVPYVALRAISDAAEESLPLPLERFVDASGRIRRAAILRRALRQPTLVPGLLALRRRAALGSRNLAEALAGLFADGAP